MKESFEDMLHDMGDVVKDGNSADDAEAVVELSAEEFDTPVATQEEVFDIQKIKQALVDDMHEQLRSIDRGEDVTWDQNGSMVEWHEKSDSGIVYGKDRKNSQHITKGELMTDGYWGVSYNLSHDVPKGLQKKYIVTNTRQKIARLLDEQIALSESQSEERKGDVVAKAYDAVLERTRSGEHPPGIIAETMVKSFLTKAMIDNNLAYEIIDVDVYEDVKHKIDFVIHIESKNTGVEVEDKEDISDIAIQFTTRDDDYGIDHKTWQIEKAKKDMEDDKSISIDDHLLISLPISHTRDLYDKWRGGKQVKPGGPDKLWSDETKEYVLRGVLEHVTSPDRCDEIVAQGLGRLSG